MGMDLTLPVDGTTYQDGDLHYTFTGGNAVLDTYTGSGSGYLVIPLTWFPSSIGTYAFNSCSGFTGSLVLPNSLTSIGSNAFAYCSGFTGSLVLPNSLTSVGTYAFQSNPRLPAVYADMDASNVASTAFASCASLTTIYVSPTAANWGSLPGTWNGIATAEWTNYPSIP